MYSEFPTALLISEAVRLAVSFNNKSYDISIQSSLVEKFLSLLNTELLIIP